MEAILVSLFNAMNSVVMTLSLTFAISVDALRGISQM